MQCYDKLKQIKNDVFVNVEVNEMKNFPGGSFRNRDSVRTPAQPTRKRQSKYLKRLLFTKGRHIFTSITPQLSE